MMWSVGCSIAPFRAFLANPVERYEYFNDSHFLAKFSYVLPSALGSLLMALPILLGAKTLKEV